MHTLDLFVVCTGAVVLVLFAAILARQRHMLRSAGALPLALQRGARWLYGVGRYQGGELRFYRALGWGTRPSRVLRRGQVQVVDRRDPTDAERRTLPATAVVITCRVDGDTVAIAFGRGADTGFVSWLESSAPL